MSTYDPKQYVSYKVGDTVRALDPRTFGVAKEGRILKIARVYVHVDFGLTRVARCCHSDILEVL